MNYSEEEKEAIERLDRKLTSEKFTKNIGMPVYIKDVEIVLNLIQKQDKIIDKMAEQFYNLYRNVEVVRDSFDMPFGNFLKSKEEVIEYFKKEVEKNEQYKEI